VAQLQTRSFSLSCFFFCPRFMTIFREVDVGDESVEGPVGWRSRWVLVWTRFGRVLDVVGAIAGDGG